MPRAWSSAIDQRNTKVRGLRITDRSRYIRHQRFAQMSLNNYNNVPAEEQLNIKAVTVAVGVIPGTGINKSIEKLFSSSVMSRYHEIEGYLMCSHR